MTEGSCHHPAPLSSPPMSPGSWHIKGRWRRSSRLCSVILLAAAVALLLVFPCVVFIFKPTWGHGGEAGHRTLPTSVSPSHRGEQAQGVHLRAHAEFFASSPLQHQQLNETLRSLSRGRVLGTLTLAPERQECTRNPLRDKEANNAFTDYEFGCKEISEMLEGGKVLIAHGAIRYVYLVKLGERKLVLRTTNAKSEASKGRKWAISKHKREATVSDAVRGDPNIVPMLGVCASTSVSPFLPKSLDQLVLTPGAERLPVSSLVSMALDATRGLQALHEAAGGVIIHFDIKPHQLMLDEEGRVKLTDFNLCKFLDIDAEGNACPLLKMSRSKGVGPWRAPEHVAGEDISQKLDVYSMGMVFYSMLALRPPFLGDQRERASQILSGIPPPVDPSWHQGLVQIMRDMWKRDPEERPSAREVVQRLEVLQKELALEFRL